MLSPSNIFSFLPSNHCSPSTDTFAFRKHAIELPKVKELCEQSDTQPLPEENIVIPSTSPIAFDATSLHDKLVFISYIPENTLRQRWYLVQVDLILTKNVNSSFLTNKEF